MGTVNSDIYSVKHNNQEIQVVWQLQKYEINSYKYSYTERVQFTYKDVEVTSFIRKERIRCDNYVRLMCTMIDKLGKEKYSKYKSYYDEIDRLSEEYIIVDDKIYKPYINDSIRSGELVNYIIFIKMADGKTLDGKTNFNQNGMNPFHKEEANKDQLINRLRNRVQEYYEQNNVLPDEQYLLIEKTKKLKDMLDWLDKNIIDLRWLYNAE